MVGFGSSRKGWFLGALLALSFLASSARAGGVYVVDAQSGSLSAIAQELYGHAKHWKKIAAWNGLEPPYRIHPGQRLLLQEEPKKASGRLRREGAPAARNPWLQAPVGRMLEGNIYTVNERAPSLSMVALELYGDSRYTRGLIRENGLQPPYRLRLGQKLRIPLEPRHDSDRGTQALIQEWKRLGNTAMVRRLSATLAPETELHSALEEGEEAMEGAQEIALHASPPGPSEAGEAPAQSPAELPGERESLSASPTEQPLLDFPEHRPPWRDQALPLTFSLGAAFHFHRLDVHDTANGGRGVILSDAMPGLEARFRPRLGESTSLLAQLSYLRTSFTPNSRESVAPLRDSTHNLYGFALGLETAQGDFRGAGLAHYQRNLFARGRPGSYGVDLVPVYSPQLALELGWSFHRAAAWALTGLGELRLLLPASQGGVALRTGIQAGAGLGWKHLMGGAALDTRLLYTRKQQNAGYRHGEQALSLLLGIDWMQP